VGSGTVAPVEIRETVDLAGPPDLVFGWVDDLERYPPWLGILTRVEPSGELTWLVDLRGKVGPFARSKRLRMRRTVHERGRLVRFERRENDGRQHSAWVLEAALEPVGATGTRLTMLLSYGGSLWGPVLEMVLHDEVVNAKRRLQELVAADASPSSAQAP
jgi:Polyketide cyclase / dehydrase and lipid transport